jgi:hypothetical protein
VLWFSLPPELAQDLARKLVTRAREVDKANVLTIWAIYHNPTDHPGKFVARKFLGEKPTTECQIGDSLEDLRMEMRRMGLAFFPRMPGDEPQIVETWL